MKGKKERQTKVEREGGKEQHKKKQTRTTKANLRKRKKRTFLENSTIIITTKQCHMTNHIKLQQKQPTSHQK
jgi:hypothetical protein